MDQSLDSRPPSEQMVDLHVFVMPSSLWREHLKSAENGVIPDTISAGFIRVFPDTKIYDLREEIETQLDEDGIIPQDYVFLKSVGSRLTRVRARQEVQLKAKAFLHPVNEIFIMENSGDNASSVVPYSTISSRGSPSRGPRHSSDTFRSDKSEFSPHKTIPPIQSPDDMSPPHQGDSAMEPMSITPTLRSSRHDHAPGAPREEEYLDQSSGDYLPPLSASPSDSPHHHSPVRNPHSISHDRGISEIEENDRRKAWEDEENRRLAEEQRQKELEKKETERAQAEKRRAEQKKRQEEEKKLREEQEKEKQEKLDEERTRIEREELEKRQQEEDRLREQERQRTEQEMKRRKTQEREQEKLQKEEERKRKEEQRQQEESERIKQEQEEEEHRRKAEAEKENSNDQLKKRLEVERSERKDLEAKREELVRRAKSLQQKTQARRNQARDLWKKRYFEEKKRTTPLEEKAERLRSELDSLHRRIMSHLEIQRDKEDGRKTKDTKPSRQSNLKIQATKLQHEIIDLQRRTDNVKMKLTAEMKLRSQAETELRALRAELIQKKIAMSLTRSQPMSLAIATPLKHELSPRYSQPVMSQR